MRAGQHRKCRFGDHRHVDQYPVAFDHAEIGEDAGQRSDLIAQLTAGELPDLAGDRVVPDQCRALAAADCDMTVERSLSPSLCNFIRLVCRRLS